MDWYGALRPQLSIVEAIYCQEGLGPIFGKPVEMDLIVAGRDAVAVDAVCGYISGFEPEEVPITAAAVRRGAGSRRAKGNRDRRGIHGVRISPVHEGFGG